MRRPFRERFRLILSELGAGLAGRPQDLNDAIRRAVPALRQSANLLAILADHNKVIARLVRDADRVIGKLADNRRDVGRFVGEAEDTASASAERAVDLQENWRTLPGFLTELTPTMAKLEEAAREQRPVLVDLSASATGLTRFLDLGAEFSDASRPALRALADAASPTGRRGPRGRSSRGSARYATTPAPAWTSPTTSRSRSRTGTTRSAPSSRTRSAPAARASPAPRRSLQYLFTQAIQTNAFDQMGHLSRVVTGPEPLRAR